MYYIECNGTRITGLIDGQANLPEIDEDTYHLIREGMRNRQVFIVEGKNIFMEDQGKLRQVLDRQEILNRKFLYEGEHFCTKYLTRILPLYIVSQVPLNVESKSKGVLEFRPTELPTIAKNLAHFLNKQIQDLNGITGEQHGRELIYTLS